MSTMLEILGANVCGYSLPLSEYSFYSKVRPEIEYHVEGDIADSENVKKTVEEFKPEIIIHLASHSSLDGSMQIPDFILRTNMMGVLNILEAARNTDSVKTVLIVTSDKCYKVTDTNEPYTEASLLGGDNPYSTSKVCQELLSECYEKTFFNDKDTVRLATARASNVIGAGDYNITRLMPYLLDCFLNNNIPQIRNVHAIRPWQYVLDVLYGYLLLIEKLYNSAGVTAVYDGAYNFGPDESGFVEVGKVAEMTGKCFGSNYTVDCEATSNRLKNEAYILKLDSSKAADTLGWKAKTSIEEAISQTADFVIREKNGGKTADLCREQVTDYLSKIISSEME